MLHRISQCRPRKTLLGYNFMFRFWLYYVSHKLIDLKMKIQRKLSVCARCLCEI